MRFSVRLWSTKRDRLLFYFDSRFLACSLCVCLPRCAFSSFSLFSPDSSILKLSPCTRTMSTSYSASNESALLHASLTWKINNFSYRDTCVVSPYFSDEKKNDFYLNLFPNENGHVLLLILIPNKQLKVKCKLSLINSHGQKRLLHEKTGRLFPIKTMPNFVRMDIPQFISRAALLKASNGYLPDDTLTLHCEIGHLDKEIVNVQVVPSQADTMAKVFGTLSVDYGNLLKSGNLADVKLIVNGKTIHAHKLILSVRSSVFAAMFSHDTKEKMENQVEIPDVSTEAFKKFLSYLYTDTVPILANIKSAEELLVISDKYGSDQLKFFCEDYLISQMSIETAPNLLLLANSVNATKLKESAIEFIRSRGSELFTAMENEPEQMINMFQYLAVKNDDKKESK